MNGYNWTYRVVDIETGVIIKSELGYDEAVKVVARENADDFRVVLQSE